MAIKHTSEKPLDQLAIIDVAWPVLDKKSMVSRIHVDTPAGCVLVGTPAMYEEIRERIHPILLQHRGDNIQVWARAEGLDIEFTSRTGVHYLIATMFTAGAIMAFSRNDDFGILVFCDVHGAPGLVAAVEEAVAALLKDAGLPDDSAPAA